MILYQLLDFWQIINNRIQHIFRIFWYPNKRDQRYLKLANHQSEIKNRGHIDTHKLITYTNRDTQKIIQNHSEPRSENIHTQNAQLSKGNYIAFTTSFRIH